MPHLAAPSFSRAIGNIHATEELGFMTALGEYKTVEDGAEKKILEGKIKLSGRSAVLDGKRLTIECGRVVFFKSAGETTCEDVASVKEESADHAPRDRMAIITVRKNGALKFNGRWKTVFR